MRNCGLIHTEALQANPAKPTTCWGCETGPPLYSPRRLESLAICWCNYKGSTSYSVIYKVRPESNSRPPALQRSELNTAIGIGRRSIAKAVTIPFRLVRSERLVMWKYLSNDINVRINTVTLLRYVPTLAKMSFVGTRNGNFSRIPCGSSKKINSVAT